VDKHISVWKRRLAVVRVRNANHRHRVDKRLGGNSPLPGVELASKENARPGKELLPKTGPWPVKQRVQAVVLLGEERHDYPDSSQDKSRIPRG
jgi:hypothetical protein